VPIRVIYDHRYVTREETPPTVEQFVKQRTRWNQGFLQVLMKGDWLRLPTWEQRMLALYTLAFPILQALTALYVPFSIWLLLFGKMPVLVSMISALPAYVLLVQILISLGGLYEFTAKHQLQRSRRSELALLVGYLPYQWLLGFAALRAMWRKWRGNNAWEKTRHIGAHRTGQFAYAEAEAVPQESVQPRELAVGE
jgi:glycosyltransferase XagB